MNNSNSQEELLNTIAEKCGDSILANKTIDMVESLCVEKSLNFNKVAEEVIRVLNSIEQINHMYNFVKAVVNRLDPNLFGNVVVKYEPIVQPLISDLREKGFRMTAEDTAWLSVVWEYIINSQNVNVNECMALNHKIIAYMVSKKATSFSDYKDLLKKSNTLKKYNIEWDKLDEKADLINSEWNKHCDEMGVDD